jgi:hypothetical protein
MGECGMSKQMRKAFEAWLPTRFAVSSVVLSRDGDTYQHARIRDLWAGWQAARAPQWISVEERLPESGQMVLATYVNEAGRRRTVVGRHVKRWTEESSCDDDCNDEYCEERDNYYLVEGWIEQQDNWGEYASIYIVEGVVDFWQPLPPPPAQGEQP